jgi:hypothetical protein
MVALAELSPGAAGLRTANPRSHRNLGFAAGGRRPVRHGRFRVAPRAGAPRRRVRGQVLHRVLEFGAFLVLLPLLAAALLFLISAFTPVVAVAVALFIPALVPIFAVILGIALTFDLEAGPRQGGAP